MSFQNWETADPLAFCDGETPEAHLALQDYVAMGSDRSLKKLVEQYREMATQNLSVPTTRLQTLETWSVQNQWRARWFEYERQQRQQKLARQAERREQWQNQSWEVANQLLKKAGLMLNFPLVETETKDGKQYIKPARWTMDSVAKLLAIAEKLMRLSLDPDNDWEDIKPSQFEELPPGMTEEDIDIVVEEMAAFVIKRHEEKTRRSNNLPNYPR